MKILKLSVVTKDRTIPWTFPVKRIVNAGYVGRDLATVKAHIEELGREGVLAPPSVPMIFPVLSHNVTTEGQIEVIGDRTSGEAEYVLLLDGEHVFVGVGSDHTDREIETQSIVNSKQVCPNVLSSKVWRYEDVEQGWDDLVIESWVKPSRGNDWVLYQKAPLSTIVSVTHLMDLVKSRLRDGQTHGLVIFSGTVPLLSREMIFGSAFRADLIDKRLGIRLTCEYEVSRLDYLEGPAA